MNVEAIVSRLESVTGLRGKVGVGLPPQTDSLSAGMCCWITDLTETASPSGRISQPSIQRIECRVGLITTGSDLGTLLPLRDAIRARLVDFQPETEPSGDPLSYRTGRMEFLDPGYLVWRDEYSYNYYVDMQEIV